MDGDSLLQPVSPVDSVPSAPASPVGSGPGSPMLAAAAPRPRRVSGSRQPLSPPRRGGFPQRRQRPAAEKKRRPRVSISEKVDTFSSPLLRAQVRTDVSWARPTAARPAVQQRERYEEVSLVCGLLAILWVHYSVCFWCVVVFANSYDSCPGGGTDDFTGMECCDQPMLPAWFMTHGVLGLTATPVLAPVFFLRMRKVNANVFTFWVKVGRAEAALHLLSVAVHFVVWILGNGWVWLSNEAGCGELTREGRKVMSASYAGVCGYALLHYYVYYFRGVRQCFSLCVYSRRERDTGMDVL